MRNLESISISDKPLNEYVYNDLECTEIKAGKELIEENLLTLNDRFEEYSTQKTSLEKISTKEYEKDLHEKLYHLYDSKDKLKEKVRAIAGSICPYCGTPDLPYHVDHYLPRSKFPEYSVFTSNLIPACAACNSRYKGKFYLNGSKRKYLNPYFDEFIETIKFLKCTLSVEKNYLVVEFSIDTNIESTHEYGSHIIKSHFNGLHLAERYKNLIINEVFKRFFNEYVNVDNDSKKPFFLDVSTEELKKDIEKKLRSLRSYNINHWEKVFFESLKECDDCLKLIVDKKIKLTA